MIFDVVKTFGRNKWSESKIISTLCLVEEAIILNIPFKSQTLLLNKNNYPWLSLIREFFPKWFDLATIEQIDG